MLLGRKFRLGRSTPLTEDSSGIALFMVMAAVSILAILVTEFTYVSQVTQTLAFNSLDQVRAHYLAKSGFKLSLLRLKAFQQVKALAGGGKSGGGLGLQIPKGILDKIWNFPFIYPIPTSIPGLTPTEKDTIDKFQKESGLDGRFSALIESESSKFNINSILATFAAPSPTPSGVPRPSPQTGSDQFNPEQAKQSLTDYLNTLLSHKFNSDPDFATEYRDFRMDDFMEQLLTYMDPSHESKDNRAKDSVTPKRAPLYSIEELHTLPVMDDEIYDLFAPALTASSTSGINVNSMTDNTLKALVPNITKEEIKEFTKFRDNPEEDNAFKSDDDFFAYLLKNIGVFRNDKAEMERYLASLNKRGIRIVTDESEFKITVSAEVNRVSRRIEAWVSLGNSESASGGSKPPPTSTPGGVPPISGPGIISKPSSGIRITFMRFL